MHIVFGIKKRMVLFLINHIFAGTRESFWNVKRNLLNSIGYSIGEGTKVVDNCDLGPEVTFQTGGHEIGSDERRAGKGVCYSQYVGNGVWIGGRATVLGNTRIGDGSIVAGCACVVKDIPGNTLAGGVPAKMIRRLEA